MTDAERAARQALDDYFVAWNAADIDALRQTMHFPFVTIGPAGQVIVAQTAADFDTDFDALRAREGWGSSTVDSYTPVASAPTKVHCQVTFSRYHPDGARYGGGNVLYIFTQQAGHWGMQLRSGMPEPRQ